jgi:hypothetical protein
MSKEANPPDERHHTEYAYDPGHGFVSGPLANDVLRSLTGMLEVAKWLLEQEVEPGLQDIYGR